MPELPDVDGSRASDAVLAGDRLVYRVMKERGYPVGDFDAQADLVSVDHPEVVENYRFAHGVRERAQTRQATTEDLREALLRYRSLFSELLRGDDDHRADGPGEEAVRTPDTEASQVTDERP